MLLDVGQQLRRNGLLPLFASGFRQRHLPEQLGQHHRQVPPEHRAVPGLLPAEFPVHPLECGLHLRQLPVPEGAEGPHALPGEPEVLKGRQAQKGKGVFGVHELLPQKLRLQQDVVVGQSPLRPEGVGLPVVDEQQVPPLHPVLPPSDVLDSGALEDVDDLQKIVGVDLLVLGVDHPLHRNVLPGVQELLRRKLPHPSASLHQPL